MEGLHEKIDLAMPDGIFDMRFNQNPNEPVDDEQFLQATSQAGIQVEKKKSLRQARELTKGTAAADLSTGKREVTNGKNNKETPKPKDKARQRERTNPRPQRNDKWGTPGNWTSEAAAIEGVSNKERQDHRAGKGCFRC